jgi:hypothetical protein
VRVIQCPKSLKKQIWNTWKMKMSFNQPCLRFSSLCLEFCCHLCFWDQKC